MTWLALLTLALLGAVPLAHAVQRRRDRMRCRRCQFTDGYEKEKQ